MQKTTVVIPAYEPDKKIETLVQALIGRIPVLVVDDGSGDAYTEIFQAVEDMGAVVLHHAQNRGKGAALKTAFEFLHKSGENSHVVTADADGQHSVEDILMIASALGQYTDVALLGVRDVSQMPFRSRFGNTVTRSVFRLLTGLNISDTQTGLRGIPANLIEKMLTVVGDRYEYEMNMLLAFKKWDIFLVEIPIQTIYLDGNRTSHFHPLRDGLRVFVQLFRYTFISLMCAILDYGLYCLLIKIFLPAWSYAIARVFSACVNYQMNRRMVFQARPSAKSAMAYALLAGFSMAAGALGTGLLSSLAINSIFAKAILDTLLFTVNYLVQKKIVFNHAAANPTAENSVHEKLR